MTNWIVRIGYTKHFFNSNTSVQGFNSRNKYFIENVKRNDKLFFVGRNTKCKIVAFAIFDSIKYRTNITPTNIVYNWIFHNPDDNGRWKNSKWDVEMHYNNYFDLRSITTINLISNIITQNANGIIPRSIVDQSTFNFDYVRIFIENYKICSFFTRNKKLIDF